MRQCDLNVFFPFSSQKHMAINKVFKSTKCDIVKQKDKTHIILKPCKILETGGK